MKEGDIYRELKQNEVQNIACLLASGNVHGVNQTCGATMKLLPDNICHRVHIHYQLVFDTVSSSITTFPLMWQMVCTICTGLRCEHFMHHFIALCTQMLDSPSRCSHEGKDTPQGHFSWKYPYHVFGWNSYRLWSSASALIVPVYRGHPNEW